MIKSSLLGVIAFIIMFLEFPLPLFPDFLKIDLSDVPAVIAGFALGPVAGVLVEVIKNLLHLLRTTTSGVGELANFLVGVAFVVPASYIYSIKKDKRHALVGMIVGIVVMGIVGAIANYYVLIPFYSKFMPIEAIIEWASTANKYIVDLKTYILYAVVPFNLVKGVIVSIVTLLVYKRVSKVIH